MPDPKTLAEIRAILAVDKAWVASGEMSWIDAGGRPRGYKFRERLALEDGSQPATLFVEGYFKPSTIPGCADKLSIGLFFRNQRILAVDENGPSGHVNKVGIGRPFYGKRIGHPQIHTVSDDCIYGYAEPIETMPFDGYWNYFAHEARIYGAPPFQLPVLQLGLLV